jgi:UDP:flavonoid glycosyltransferase YjiC (YdhE family)
VRVLAACSLGGAGHLQPLLPFLDAAAAAGHRTLVLAPASMGAQVADAGHDFVPGDEPPEDQVAPIRDALPLVSAREASVLGNRELFGRLATLAMLPTTERVLAEWRPAVVLRDPCEYSSAVLAPRFDIPTAQVAIDLAEVEWGSLDVAAPALSAYRPGLDIEIRNTPYLSRFPDALDPSPFVDTRRFNLPASISDRLPDWWAGSDAPLVYVTFGTVLGRMSVAAEAYRTVLAAVAGITDVRVLLTVGPFDPAQLGPLPDHVHIERWVDQAAVLTEARVVVCHGGSGTTFGALAAGVPVVVIPRFGGQRVNADRVAAVGAGVVVPALADSASVAHTVVRVARDHGYRDAARRVAAEMAGAPAVGEVLAELLSGPSRC